MSTKIEWTDETWNPVVGCSHVSPGCDHCYAERMAIRQAYMGNTNYSEVVKYEQGYGGVIVPRGWSGRCGFNEKALDIPLHWRKSRRIFVCSMGDLFHESVPFAWQRQVFAIMALCPRHTFQVLTKRPEVMATCIKLLESGGGPVDALSNEAYAITRSDEAACMVANSMNGCLGEGHNLGWPLRNVWLGVTAENQAMANERIPLLVRIPAEKRFVSCEPMIGSINISDAITRTHIDHFIDWVICGGESGPGARPMHPDWVRSLRDQCNVAGVPFFFKQWGDNPHPSAFDAPLGKVNACMQAKHNGAVLDGRKWKEFPE